MVQVILSFAISYCFGGISTAPNFICSQADIRKGMAMSPLTVEILMDCRNVMLAALNISLICFLKLKYYGTFTYITQIIHLDAQKHEVYLCLPLIQFIFI
jgi:hypothetical protein